MRLLKTFLFLAVLSLLCSITYGQGQTTVYMTGADSQATIQRGGTGSNQVLVVPLDTAHKFNNLRYPGRIAVYAGVLWFYDTTTHKYIASNAGGAPTVDTSLYKRKDDSVNNSGYTTRGHLNDTLNQYYTTAESDAIFEPILGFTPAPDTRAINTTYPVQGGGNLTADRTISLDTTKWHSSDYYNTVYAPIGAAVGTLQTVTDNGNTTTNRISIGGNSLTNSDAIVTAKSSSATNLMRLENTSGRNALFYFMPVANNEAGGGLVISDSTTSDQFESRYGLMVQNRNSDKSGNSIGFIDQHDVITGFIGMNAGGTRLTIYSEAPSGSGTNFPSIGLASAGTVGGNTQGWLWAQLDSTTKLYHYPTPSTPTAGFTFNSKNGDIGLGATSVSGTGYGIQFKRRATIDSASTNPGTTPVTNYDFLVRNQTTPFAMERLPFDNFQRGAADGSTVGINTYAAADFNSSGSTISLDYVNGQKATASLNGYVSTTDQTLGAGQKTLAYGTLPSDGSKSAVIVSATTGAGTVTGTQTTMQVNTTGQGSTVGETIVGLFSTVSAGYTGNGTNLAGIFLNNTAGTGTGTGGTSGNVSYRPVGNIGVQMRAEATCMGNEVGGAFLVGGGNINIATWGAATGAKNSAINVGIAGFAENTGSTPTYCGGYFAAGSYGSSMPTFPTAALACDNVANAVDIFVARDNGTAVFKIPDGGNMIITAGTPPASAAAAGVTGTVIFGTDNYLYRCISTNTWVRVLMATW